MIIISIEKKIANKFLDIAPILGIISGICLIAYSGVATFISDYNQTRVVSEYEEHIKATSNTEIQQLKTKATEYNETIARVVGEGDYKNVDAANKELKRKSIFKLGEMEGYITIPCIDVALPIYEGTEEGSLYNGVGHMPSTSLPCGGTGTHCVIAGHSALSTATLFDNLDKVKVNDVFYIKFFDETLKYKVDKIYTNVNPFDADDYIKIHKGQDFVTLLTCTPKTINTHRLLVRGRRVELTNEEKEKESDKTTSNVTNKYVKQQLKKKEAQIRYSIIISSALGVLFLLIVLILYIKKRRRGNIEKE